MMHMAVPNIDQFIETIEQIPTLPIVSSHIMELLNDERITLSKIAGIIEKDQALAVRILKVANSSFYGMLNRVSSIDHALSILGTQEVKGVLLSFSIHNFFSQREGDQFDRTRFWKHSVICSQVAKYLARVFDAAADDTLFLSGLIQYFQDKYGEIIEFVSSHHETFSKAEKHILGVTHYQVAAKLLQQWKLPDKVVHQVFYHHAPWHDRNYSTGSILIFLANQFTKLAGYPCLTSESQNGLTQLQNANVLMFLGKSGFELDSNGIERLTLQIRDFISLEAENMLRFFDS